MKNTIRVERAILNISQAELAERVQVTRQTINAIELGKYSPSAVLAIKIARVFGKKMEDVFELEEGDWIHFDFVYRRNTNMETLANQG